MFEKSELPENMGAYSGEDRLERIRSAVEMQNLTRSADAPPIQMVEFDDLKQHLNDTDAPDDGRQVLLVKIQNHYLALDVLKKDGKKSCITLDAANDFRSYGVMNEFEEQGYTTYMASGLSEDIERNLQSDTSSCSLFAFDHCVQLSHENPVELHQNVEDWSVDEAFTWDKLPVNFLWNVQSNTFLKEYRETHEKEMSTVMQNGLTMEQYISRGGYDETNSTHNNSINVHVFSKVRDAHQLVEKDWIMTRREMASDMDEKLVALRESNNTVDLKPLEELVHQFEQSTGDPIESTFKQNFDQLSSELEASQVSIERTQKYKGIIETMGKGHGPSEEEADVAHDHKPIRRS
jgi:hypothetical protein